MSTRKLAHFMSGSECDLMLHYRCVECVCHHSSSNPPSGVPVVTDVELRVGLSRALVTLVFFLHSNATWSLHSLWQFIPQSEKSNRIHKVSEQELVVV